MLERLSREAPNTVSAGIDLLLYWITERLRVGKLKESGALRPWSKDPIFQEASFCNVERERDRGTVWIREHWRDPNRDNPDVWFLMAVARLINAPEVLGAITLPLPWDRDRFVAEMEARWTQGLLLQGPAYQPPAAGIDALHICTLPTTFLARYGPLVKLCARSRATLAKTSSIA